MRALTREFHLQTIELALFCRVTAEALTSSPVVSLHGETALQ